MDEFLKITIRSAGEIAKEYFTQGVSATTKANLGDLLTVADKAVENFLVQKILAEYPDHHIHSEELAEDINPGGEYEWVIDPIDGTRNFAGAIPFWCHLIAILKNGEPYLAAAYNPIADELFFAEAGKGAYLNGRQIKVNSVDTLDFSFGHIVRNTAQDVAGFKQLALRVINETTAWAHNFGTMLSACYVAAGGADFFAINCGYDHDYLAPALICAEAGAQVTDSEGNPWVRGRRDLVIANPLLHAKLLQFFK